VKQLKQQFGSVTIAQSGPPGNFEISVDVGGDYEKLGPTVFAASKYIDLAGLSMEDETVFPQAITVQCSGPPFIGGVAGDVMAVLNLMTSIPIDLTLAYWATGIWLNDGPGFSLSQQNYEHVLYARHETFSLDIDYAAAYPVKVYSNQYGSMSPTASDRIYCYQIFVIDNTATTATVPATRHLVVADTKAEPEFEYLMRLKRSYDLQNEPDVD